MEIIPRMLAGSRFSNTQPRPCESVCQLTGSLDIVVVVGTVATGTVSVVGNGVDSGGVGDGAVTVGATTAVGSGGDFMAATMAL